MATPPRLHDVRRLADVRAPWCVTIYGDADFWLRGSHPTDEARAQIRSALDGLQIGGAPAEVADTIHQQLDRVSAPLVSRPNQADRRARAVGIFATETDVEVFVLTTSVSPWVGVADRFLIGPLLEGALALVPPVFVLAISENEARLVDVTKSPAERVEVPDLPHDLKSTISLDLTGDRETLAHLRTSEDPKVRLREYARALDHAVAPVVREAGATLVLAAAEPLESIYRSVSSSSLASPAIGGNHDRESIGELANLAAPVIERHRRETTEARLTRLAEMPARDLVVADLDQIATAVRDGAVDTLFVDTARRLPSPAEAFEGITTLDRVDEIVRGALSTDATIVPVRSDDLPSADPVAAVLRYPRPR